MQSGSAAQRHHLRGLDSIRFLAALWVVLSHVGAFPLPASVASSQGALRVLVGLYHCLFAGPAAVMVFFVISGLVIHAPYAAGAPLRPLPYLGRRLLRIGVPLLVAQALDRCLRTGAIDAVLWSLYAELAYYLLYPFVLAARRRIGFGPVLLVAFAGSFALTFSSRALISPVQHGPLTGWLFGLPVWLLGCMVAERWEHDRLARLVASRIDWARAAIWVLSSATVGLHFHAGASYTRTLIVFGLAAAPWIAAELVHTQRAHARPVPFLERAGGWSYSLYLTHPIAFTLFHRHIGVPTHAGTYIVMLAMILGGAYAFARLVERPAHALARRLGR